MFGKILNKMESRYRVYTLIICTAKLDIQLISYIKGTISVHSFNGDYLSISKYTGSCEYLFHKIPSIIIIIRDSENICTVAILQNNLHLFVLFLQIFRLPKYALLICLYSVGLSVCIIDENKNITFVSSWKPNIVAVYFKNIHSKTHTYIRKSILLKIFIFLCSNVTCKPMLIIFISKINHLSLKLFGWLHCSQSKQKHLYCLHMINRLFS